MRRLVAVAAGLAVVLFAGLVGVFQAAGARNDVVLVVNASGLSSPERGAYLFGAAGCAGCHTQDVDDAVALAGGRELETPFGTFFGPNITAHPQAGIGGWSDGDFIRALRFGVAPDGRNYYPVFPYTSFTRMTDQDLLDIKAHLFSQPTSDRPSQPHQVGFPFASRSVLSLWKLLNFGPGPFTPDANQSQSWNRGAYLVRAVVHCGECHTPRNVMGGSRNALALSGTDVGPTGGPVPNITPDPETGIGGWNQGDLSFVLSLGFLPDGDVVGSDMAEVVRESTGDLTRADQDAIAQYVLSLPAIHHSVGRDE